MNGAIDMEARRRIAEELLQGHRLGEAWGGFAPCPGEGQHNGKTGPKDFKVQLEGAPTGFCLHRSCTEDVDRWNYELRRRIWQHENGAESNGTTGKDGDMRNVAAMPRAEKEKRRQELNMGAVEKVIKGVPPISREWLRQRSPIDPAAAGLPGFFSALYEPGERVLVFTRFTSQGDFAWWEGKGGYRLGDRPDVKAVRSELPKGGKCGVWFLTNPVDLQWHPVKHLSADGGRKLSRRSETGVTAFRYLVLESDEVEEALWLRVLVNLRLPIVAVYTSGSRSVHALVRIGAASKADWDMARNQISPLLTALGADGAAMSAVRLSRLPFTVRRGSEGPEGYKPWTVPGKQELLWLDDKPDGRGMIAKGVQRI